MLTRGPAESQPSRPEPGRTEAAENGAAAGLRAQLLIPGPDLWAEGLATPAQGLHLRGRKFAMETGQDRQDIKTGQDRQDSTGQDRTGQTDRTGQERKTGQDRQDRTAQDR